MARIYEPGDKVTIDNDTLNIYTVIYLFETPDKEKKVYLQRESTSLSWSINSPRMKIYKEEL